MKRNGLKRKLDFANRKRKEKAIRFVVAAILAINITRGCSGAPTPQHAFGEQRDSLSTQPGVKVAIALTFNSMGRTGQRNDKIWPS